jgi:hypothetical protein
MTNLSACVIALVTLLMQTRVAQQPPKERTLDLLPIPDPSAEMAVQPVCGCGSVSSDSDEAKPQLTITLVRVSPEAVAVGHEVVFELLAEHRGGPPVLLPITQDPSLAQNSCQMANGDVFAIPALLLKNTNTPIAVGPRLSGSATVFDSTMILKAGERLRLRVTAPVTSMDRRRAVSDNPQDLHVEATLMVQRSECGAVFARSTNDLVLHVSRPTR